MSAIKPEDILTAEDTVRVWEYEGHTCAIRRVANLLGGFNGDIYYCGYVQLQNGDEVTQDTVDVPGDLTYPTDIDRLDAVRSGYIGFDTDHWYTQDMGLMDTAAAVHDLVDDIIDQNEEVSSGDA